MIKKIILIIVSLAMLFAIAGCQLAVEGKGAAEPGTDALCGVFITFKYFDSDGFYLEGFETDGVQTPLYDQGGRKYAVIEDNGGRKDYVFKGIKGQRMFGINVPGDADNDDYNTTFADELLMDRKTAYNQTDSGLELTLEGTLYVCPKVIGGDITCYSNPVYQTPDGQVYMTAGQGISADLGTGASSMTQTLSGTSTKNVNGETESRTTTVKLTVTAIDYIEKYILKEFDSEDRMISALEITRDSAPKEIALNDNTVYAVLEKHCVDADGKAYAERSIMDMSLEYLDARFINDDGFAQGYGIALKNRPALSTRY